MYCTVIFVEFGDAPKITGLEYVRRRKAADALTRYRRRAPNMNQRERAAALRQLAEAFRD